MGSFEKIYIKNDMIVWERALDTELRNERKIRKDNLANKITENTKTLKYKMVNKKRW